MEIKELKDALQEAIADVKKSVDARDADVKKYGEVAEQTSLALTKATERLDQVKADFDGLSDRVEKMELENKRFMDNAYEAEQSIGQQFVNSEAFKSMAQRGAKNSDPVRVIKNITGLAASAGALVRPDRRPDVIIPPNRPTRIRDLLPSIPISASSVEVMRQNVFTNLAGPQQPSSPNTAIAAGELQTKPQSNITYELVTLPVRTMAHWLPVSRQILSDAPQLQALINGRLMYGLDLNMDAQLLLGDGTNQNLTGLLVDANINNIGGLPIGTTLANVPGAMLDHIRKAITECQKFEFYNINGVVLNPQDWERIELAKGIDGHYIWVTVPNAGESRLWRVPVVITNAMPQGEFLLGDWTLGATVYDRQEMDVRISESHSDYFVRNAVAVLAEERLAFGIELPKAYTKGSFAVTTT